MCHSWSVARGRLCWLPGLGQAATELHGKNGHTHEARAACPLRSWGSCGFASCAARSALARSCPWSGCPPLTPASSSEHSFLFVPALSRGLCPSLCPLFCTGWPAATRRLQRAASPRRPPLLGGRQIGARCQPPAPAEPEAAPATSRGRRLNGAASVIAGAGRHASPLSPPSAACKADRQRNSASFVGSSPAWRVVECRGPARLPTHATCPARPLSRDLEEKRMFVHVFKELRRKQVGAGGERGRGRGGTPTQPGLAALLPSCAPVAAAPAAAAASVVEKPHASCGAGRGS